LVRGKKRQRSGKKDWERGRGGDERKRLRSLSQNTPLDARNTNNTNTQKPRLGEGLRIKGLIFRLGRSGRIKARRERD